MDHRNMPTEEITIASLTKRVFRHSLATISDPAERNKKISEEISIKIRRMSIETLARLLVYMYKSQSSVLSELQEIVLRRVTTEILKLASEEATQTAPR